MEIRRRPLGSIHSPLVFRVLFILALVFPLSCSSDSSGPPDPSPDPSIATTLIAVEGEGLQAPAGTILPEGPTVRLMDQYGAAMAGEFISFHVVEGGGRAAVTSRQTTSAGLARIPWILGPTPGAPQRIRATVASLSVEIQASSIPPVPGQSYFGRSQYTEYLPGNMPLVISAPHGGYLKPDEVPDRGYGTMVQDRNTQELARQIRDAVWEQTGFYPHVILSLLHRTKLDPNREIVEAAQGNLDSERAWWEFQTYIDEAERIVEESFGEGFYIDLHGHGHTIQRLELGYLLSSTDLSNTNETLSQSSYVTKSSVKTLAEKAGVNFPDLIRGPTSLGTLLEMEGIPAVPSQSQPNPGGNAYFSGGYNTVQHGSRNGGSVSGVQIECNYTGIRDTPENREAFAQALGRSMATYFPLFFGFPFAPVEAVATR